MTAQPHPLLDWDTPEESSVPEPVNGPCQGLAFALLFMGAAGCACMAASVGFWYWLGGVQP